MPAADKPIPGKAYGSIPHIPGSRLGPGDHHCDPSMAVIACRQARRGDRVIATEKLDGSCVAVVRRGGDILALMRAGYLASSSPHEHLHHFAAWVAANRSRFLMLPEDRRIVGEWMAMAHGTVYDLQGEPFVPFDVIDGYGTPVRRLPHDEARHVFAQADLEGARVLHDGDALSVDRAREILGEGGFHGARTRPEGAVWRVETEGRFNFIVKWVDPSKEDGALIPRISGGDPVWHWRPEAA